MPMKNPAHAGRIVRSACLEPLGLSVTDGAKVLGVTRQTLTKIITGKSGISAEMAIRLAKAFGSTAEAWVRMQVSYDLAQARKEESINQSAPSARSARVAPELIFGCVTNGLCDTTARNLNLYTAPSFVF